MSDHIVTTEEIMEFLLEHMPMKETVFTKENALDIFLTKADARALFATKDDLRAMEGRADSKLQAMEGRLITAIEQISRAFVRSDREQMALRGQNSRHEDRMEIIERKLGLAA